MKTNTHTHRHGHTHTLTMTRNVICDGIWDSGNVRICALLWLTHSYYYRCKATSCPIYSNVCLRARCAVCMCSISLRIIFFSSHFIVWPYENAKIHACLRTRIAFYFLLIRRCMRSIGRSVTTDVVVVQLTGEIFLSVSCLSTPNRLYKLISIWFLQCDTSFDWIHMCVPIT